MHFGTKGVIGSPVIIRSIPEYVMVRMCTQDLDATVDEANAESEEGSDEVCMYVCTNKLLKYHLPLTSNFPLLQTFHVKEAQAVAPDDFR